MKFNASQVYIIMSFLTSLANATMFTTYAVYYIAALGLNPFQLLMVGMVLELTVLVFEGITGVVADTYSRRLSILVGMFVLGTGFVLEGVIPSLLTAVPLLSAFVWILVSQLFFGIGHTLISGADTAWVVDEVGEEKMGSLFLRAKRISLIATPFGIALSVGLSMLAPNLPYLIGGCMYLGLGLFLLLFLRETKFVRPKRSPQSSHWHDMKSTWLAGFQVVRTQPVLLMILLVTICSGAASEGYDRLREAHLINEIGFPEGVHLSMAMWFGLIAAVTAILGMGAVRVAERNLNTENERVVMIGMLVLTGLRIIAILTFAFAPDFYWALGALLLIGIINSVSSPLYDTWLNMNIESKVRATVLSMMSQSNALGQTAGGPIVGWVGNRVSIRASLVVAGVLLVPILAVFGRVLRKR